MLVLLVGAEADWVNELRLTLANYALRKAVNPPDGFKCTVKGKHPNGCHCWSPSGSPAERQTDDDCHMPPQCLMYSATTSGNFSFTNISLQANLHEQLAAWNVPAKMYQSFDAAAAVESANFAAFDLDVNDHKAHYSANVGTLRKWQGSLYLGYVSGRCDGEMVQPYKRTVRPGDCHGTNRGQKERGYTNAEIAMINDGLQAYAYKEAAKEAQPLVESARQLV